VSTVRPVFATGTLDQQQLNFNNRFDLAVPPPAAFFAETFTAGLGGSLTEVDLIIGQVACSSCGPVVVEIHDGSPTGALLASTSLPSGSIPSSSIPTNFVAFTFSTPATSIISHVYAIVVTTSSTTYPSNIYTIHEYDPGIVGPCYSGGGAYDNQGSGWNQITSSAGTCPFGYLAFKTFVQGATTGLGVNCNPSTVNVGGSSTCTATLSGFAGSVAGETITWSQVGGSGTATFPSGNTCSLAPASCSTTVVGDPGNIILHASYPGDSSNAASSGSFTLTVNSAAPIPEYPLGLAPLASLMIPAYVIIKRRTRTGQTLD